MVTKLKFNNLEYLVDFSKPLDISIPLRAGAENVNAWYVSPPKIEPVRMGDWVGEVKQGAAVNFRNIFINPHGHGTHTECVGHISMEDYSLNQCLKQFLFFCELISVTPESAGDDQIITLEQIKQLINFPGTEAIVLRTLPNSEEKCSRQYSYTNPPYLQHEAAAWLCEQGVKHLLIDTPSVDKEKDNGKLSSHHAFWKYPHQTRLDCTISEMVYANNQILDGLYFLNLQITALENDASPSKPVLYRMSIP